MSVCIDTSFDFREKILYICVVIFRRKHVAKILYEFILKQIGERWIHVRRYSRKKRDKLFKILDELLVKFRDDIKIRIIGLTIPKGYNRFKKYAFVEKIIAKIITAQPFCVDTIYACTYLNTGGVSSSWTNVDIH